MVSPRVQQGGKLVCYGHRKPLAYISKQHDGCGGHDSHRRRGCRPIALGLRCMGRCTDVGLCATSHGTADADVVQTTAIRFSERLLAWSHLANVGYTKKHGHVGMTRRNGCSARDEWYC